MQSVSEKTQEQYEEELLKRIEDATYIITGLENYAPYNKVIDMFKENRSFIDDNWHLVHDPMKLAELRMAKMAYNTLIEYIPNLKNDREKFKVEFAKLNNQDDVILKDVDNA